MEYRTLGTSGAVVSTYALGTMTFGNETDEPGSHAQLDRYVEAGGNFIDTADVYTAGVSEDIVGRWLAKSSARDSVVLATKGRFPTGDGPNDVGTSRRHLRRALEASLSRLGVDHIDLYQLHAWDPITPLDETLSFLEDAVRAGKISYGGLSNFTGWQLQKACDLIAHRGWSPLGGGWLTGKYSFDELPTGATRLGENPDRGVESWHRRSQNQRVRDVVDAVREIAEARGISMAQVALAWIVDRPAMTSVILGARTLEQLDDNLAAADLHLTAEETDMLDRASDPGAADYPYGGPGVAQRDRPISGGRA